VTEKTSKFFSNICSKQDTSETTLLRHKAAIYFIKVCVEELKGGDSLNATLYTSSLPN
jgi:hypothetical protein